MGPRGHFYPCMYHVMDILHCLGQVYAGTVIGVELYVQRRLCPIFSSGVG